MPLYRRILPRSPWRFSLGNLRERFLVLGSFANQLHRRVDGAAVNRRQGFKNVEDFSVLATLVSPIDCYLRQHAQSMTYKNVSVNRFYPFIYVEKA